MKVKISYLVCIFVIIGGVLLTNNIQPVEAQIVQPPQFNLPKQDPCLPGQPCQDKNGNWYIQSDSRLLSDLLGDTKSTGGPDDYGYTWSDSVTYSWVDAATGTNTGLTDRSQTGPISLPFNFPYYYNTYSKIYISSFGYLTFHDQYLDSQSEIPHTNEPNDVIAPYWAPNYPNLSSGWIRYKSGGTFPNRYFVVEWYRMQDQWGNTFTYEAILYENGNIKFQYKTINLVGDFFYCFGNGIEDPTGLDGLVFLDYCGDPPLPNIVVLFTPPGPMARVHLTPLYLDEFTQSETINDFTITVRNIGDLGSDTYDLSYSSSWPVSFLNASTSSALTDTDGDSKIDTGIIAQDSSRDIMVRVRTPGSLTTGDTNTAFITLTSSLDLTKTKTARLVSTIPAAFAQSYAQLQPGTVNLDLNWPNLITKVDLVQDRASGNSPAIAETQDYHFINVWEEAIYDNDTYLGYILQYAIIDHFGKILKPVSDLTNLSGLEGHLSDDWSPAISVAPNGNIGITWVHSEYDQNTSQSNDNIWFAMLNADGNIIYGPANISNNNQWGSYQDENQIYFYSNSIAVTEDNHFMISWDRVYHNNLSEIFYVYLQSNGNVLVAPTKIADGIPDFRIYYDSSITALSNNRFFMTYRLLDYDFGLYNMFRVYDSNGNVLNPESSIGLEGDRKFDAIQLSGGNILIANLINDWPDPSAILYVLFNENTYDYFYYSLNLVHPTFPDNLQNLSITKDNANRAILTWSDSNFRHLYYLLVDGDGPVISGPVIFHTAQDGNFIDLSSNGYGTTTNSWDLTSNVDCATNFNTSLYGSAPGGSARVELDYSNAGLSTATNAELQLTLGSGLTYTADTSGISPTVVGNTVTWDLPNLNYADTGNFSVYVTIPAASPIGTLYSLDLLLSSDGPESNPINNIASAQVMSAKLIFLPSLLK